ncbi:cation-translocating P-type ATPase [Mycoplasma phocimorsus]|uniref:cation-translocating P-type ATPase n=1 Tax=Mycoplasma phocimorsus TaxID=3045839 RepID=UPI0024C09140|nr:cation-translocating P-type ATPase [Mycoplasma phocimorsus]MDJ1647314.1 cation-translocating P-type ATPase [Mycoplasma phocimorsus]
MIKNLTTKQVEENQKIYGLNTLEKKKKKSLLLIFFEQFKDLMVILLLIATIFSFSMAIYRMISFKEISKSELIISFVEPCIILIVVIINAIIGLIQEIKSSKAVESLSKLNPLMVKVLRNNKLTEIYSEFLTIDDIVLLEAGDVVPADGIIISSSNFKVIESSLTGESMPVEKKFNKNINFSLPISEQEFKVFSSSQVVNGSAYIKITQIAKETEIGKISSLLANEKNKETPLQKRINKLGKIFGYTGLVLFALTFIVQVIFQVINNADLKMPKIWGENIMNSISLAVAAIPEGLVTFSTIILALSVKQMTKEKAIVKNLMAVETLGSTSVICSDKTGTLTQNKMTITNKSVKNITLEQLIIYGSLCSEAHIEKHNDQLQYIGDPTELAFIDYGIKNNIYKTKSDLEKQYKRIATFPFDSERKMMSTINLINDDYYLITKGAPEIILKKSHNAMQEDFELVSSWANQALRTLAISFKKLEKQELNKTQEELERNLNFVGLIGMIDPPRESSKEAIALCKKAGIKTIMITGDSATTAVAIAKQLGIFKNGDFAIQGFELAKMTDEELSSKIDHCSVFARVAPQDKIRIVKILQKKENVVAMTGDGVNDAPALKAADIGCAMGITGTEVSKEASDMILVDDNFATIVKAVSKGRSVYETIRTVIKNLLITSLAEIILVFFGLIIFNIIFKEQIANLKTEFYILSATQLLWINLFTHGFPAIALGLQKNNINYMNQKPINKNENIFARGMGIEVLIYGIIIGLISLIAYYFAAKLAIDLNMPQKVSEYGSTAAFVILGISAVLSSLNLMSSKNIITSNPLKHKLVYISVIFSMFWFLLVLFIPALARIFKLSDEILTNIKLVEISFVPLIAVFIIFELSTLIKNWIIRRKKANH